MLEAMERASNLAIDTFAESIVYRSAGGERSIRAAVRRLPEGETFADVTLRADVMPERPERGDTVYWRDYVLSVVGVESDGLTWLLSTRLRQVA